MTSDNKAPRRRIASGTYVRRVLAALTILAASLVVTFPPDPAAAAAGDISTVAGTGLAGYSGDGGAATSALLSRPSGVAVDSSGNLFIADRDNHRIRKVDTSGVITTVAGTGKFGYSGDGGPATAARLDNPIDLEVDGAGNLFIADFFNHVIRKVDTSGTITTVAGIGRRSGYSGDGGPATSALLYYPAGVDVVPSGELLIADFGNSVIRKVDTSGIITTVAGTGFAGYSGDGGPATSAQLYQAADVAQDQAGNLWIADRENHRIRRVDTSGIITTVAGTGTAGYSGDGGPASAALLNLPSGIIVDSIGNIVISEVGSSVARRIDPSGVITTVAGTGTAGYSGDGGPATSARLSSPTDVALDGSGNLFIADATNHVVRKVENVNAPLPPSVTGSTPLSPANENGPLIRGTAEAGTTVNLYTDSTCTSPVAGTGSAETFASPGIGVVVGDDTTTTFYATATNVSGTSACSSSSVTYVEDSAAPAAPTITSGPGSTGSDVSPEWEFSGEAGATFECRLTSGATVVSILGPCTSPATYDLSGEPDASYTFSVRQTDTAGNVSAFAASDYTLNRSAPPAPTITSSPGPAGSDATPTWAFSGEAGATLLCQLTRGADVVSPLGACTSPQSYDLALEPDGTYTFSVRQEIGGGAPSAFATSDYTLDWAAPAAPTITSGPGATGNDATPSWAFTGEAGATFECQLTRGGTVVATLGACTSPQSYDLSLEPDATYTFSVRQTDAAGNPSAFATSDYTLDRAAPAAPTIASGPGATGNDVAPTWAFTGDAGTTFECQLTRGADVVSPLGACTSPHSYDLGLEPDATYTFSVRQSDAAGNPSAFATSDYTLDRTAPVAPAITSGPGSTGNDPTPTWAFSGEAGATFECQLSRGADVVSALAPCTSPQSYDLGLQPDGAYTFSVRQSDTAGNTGPAATSDYTLDRVASAAPTITSGPGPTGSDATPTWTFAGEAGATFECQLTRDATVVSVLGACTSPATYDLSGEPDGAYTFSVRQTDAAGNPSAFATSDYTFDTAPDTSPSITSTPPPTSSDPSPTWAFSGNATSTFECRLTRGATVVSPFSSCSSPRTYDLSSDPDATYTFAVRSLDGAGNASSATTSDYTLDRTAPAAPTITSGPGATGSDPTPTWAFSGEAGAGFACQLNRGATVVSASAPCTSPVTYDLSSQPDGTYTFSVRQTDAAGNTGPAATADYTLDRVASAAPTITSGPGATGSDPTPTWAFSGEAGAGFACQLNRGATVVSASAPCTSPVTYDLSSQPDGTYTFSVTQTDAAGNTSPAASDRYTLDRLAPPGPTLASSPPDASPDPTPTWSFTGEAGASFICELTRGTKVVAAGACTSPLTYDLSAQPDGAYTFSVRAVDGAGNASAATTDTYTLDRTAPSAPTLTAGPGGTGRDSTPSWAFSGEPGASFACELRRGATVVAPAASCTSPATFDLSGEPEGTYTFTVTQTDAAGNLGAPTTVDYVLDRVAPAVPTIDSGPGPAGSDATVSWAFSGDAGSGFECQLTRGTTVVVAFSTCSSPHSYDLGAYPDGTYTFSVRAIDAAGNSSTPTAAGYTLERPTPVPPPAPAQPPTTSMSPATPQESPASPSTVRAGSDALDPTREIVDLRLPPPAPGPQGSAADATERTAAVLSPRRQQPPTAASRRPSTQAPDQTTALEVLAEVAGKTAFPAILVMIVVIFLAIQDRMDRNDPKLAHAPIRSEPLDFIDPPSVPIGR